MIFFFGCKYLIIIFNYDVNFDLFSRSIWNFRSFFRFWGWFCFIGIYILVGGLGLEMVIYDLGLLSVN